MTTRARSAGEDLFDDFRPGPFETLDRPAMISHLIFLTLGGLFLWLVTNTPVRPIEDMTFDQLPDRVSRLLLNPSDLAKLSAPERAAVPPEGMAPRSGEQAQEEAPTAPETRISRQVPPAGASGVPGNEPGAGGTGGGGGSSAGVRGALMAAGVAQAMAATGALAEVDRIVGDFTGVVASNRGGRALRQGAAGSGISRREGTPGARARGGVDLGGVDEILGNADKGGLGGRGTAGAGGSGGGVGRAQVRIAAPAAVAGGGKAAAEGRTAGALMAVVQRHAAAVRFCYNRLLAKSAGASGQVVIRLAVAGDGSVTEASVVRSTLGDADLDNCVLGQAREWRFPPSSESRFVFDVPFVFTPPTGG
ncbi:MAG: AgmX/PglI C-terminal domain-containing protein [Candidatus Eisenbacteria bacterium]